MLERTDSTQENQVFGKDNSTREDRVLGKLNSTQENKWCSGKPIIFERTDGTREN